MVVVLPLSIGGCDLKRTLFGIAAIALIFAVTAALAEILLRRCGRQPWAHRPLPHHVARFEHDSVLGWRNKEGVYRLPGHRHPESPPVMTVGPGGNRYAGSRPPSPSAKLVVVGGSYVFGWLLPDEETFAWKLQQRYTSLEIVNYGTGGYGTFQSLLVLERVFENEPPPDVVLYGFLGHHQRRNVGDPRWLRMLSRYRDRGHVWLPYCSLSGDGALVRHSPVRYPEWPCCTRLATIAFLQKVFLDLVARGRVAARTEVTERVILEMRDLCDRHGAQFVFLLLEASAKTKSHYEEILEQHGIPFVDCACPNDPEYRFPTDPHPNSAANALWVERIAESLGEQLCGLNSAR